ncbi:sulfotransferase family protein [Dyella solisilvae]|uniref:Sulfotransferase family protein n=1 Tax=Dyella solisilvae TaxID=1920168 RepID=A0A370KE47_9GAMM|nr:tetratricopeptide repeat-containing sulfotransferase family protein [Dyella solisilvae]RDJ00718.1 sulfotransferase family protein [Dyella solisilvae]
MASNELAPIAAAIQSGQPGRAEQLSRAALINHPDHADLKLMLALSLHMQQRLGEALPVYAELARGSDSSVHWNNYATALAESGNQAESARAFARAIELDPANITPKSQLGLLLIDMRDYLAARELLLDVVKAQPNSLAARVDAARACCLCQDVEGAADLLRRWRQWVPLNDDNLQLSLAQVLTLKDEVPDAVEVLEDLLARWPRQFDVRLLLANHYERLNRLADADAVLSPLLQDGSGATDIQRNEAQHVLATLALRSGDAATAHDLLERAGPEAENSYSHYFLLASARDKLGDTAGTMDALHVAHRIEAGERRFDSPEFFTPGAPAMPVDAPRVNAEQFARWPELIAPELHDSPIFVVGFPRSGTTLLEQVLDAHPGLQSMDENPFFNRLAGILGNHNRRILDDLSVLRQFDVDELRKRYHAMVDERIRRNWDARLVDKNPLNMHWLPMMHRLFPKARYILAIRHPCDVLLSCYMHSFRSSALAAACSNLERLAHAYVETMQRWLGEADVMHPSVMVSRYEDLVDEFPQQVERIAAFLELDDAAPMLGFDQHARSKTFIATPSYSQVIEPINRRAVGRWHKYREAFEPLLPILEPMLQHWGYSTDAPA